MSHNTINRDIAIVGLSARLPEAENLDQFLENIKTGRDCVRSISKERIKATTLPENEEYEYSSFLEDIDLFDYNFFDISRAEAEEMDPTQRLLLEVCYEALENTGNTIDHFNGSDTSVYVADARLDYYRHAEKFSGTLLTGNSKEFLSSRLNRFFNLNGKSLMVDTSCSSSIVALNHACNDLILNDTDNAVVCGTSLTIFPFKIGNKGLNIMSPVGKSKSFSADADGMGNGEAVVTVVLKRLDDALENGDNIHAVIKGVAVNNNANRSSSFTAPDSISIADVMKRAWKKAGITPDQLGFIEAHGSGTKLGDSIEVGGIDMAFEAYGAIQKKCPISSVKTNIGHTKNASGIVGMVKAILALKSKLILPGIHFDKPNPLIDFDHSAVYVNTELKEWEIPAGQKRYLGLNSIGYSGTNCHVVLTEAPDKQVPQSHNADRLTGKALLTFSGKSKAGLVNNLKALGENLDDYQDEPLSDLSYSLAVSKKHFPYRHTLLTDSYDELKQQLEAVDLDEVDFADASKKTLFFAFHPPAEPRQYLSQQPLLEQLDLNDENLSDHSFLFAYGLYNQLKAWGIVPDQFMGTAYGKVLGELLDGKIPMETALSKSQKAVDHYEDIEQRLFKWAQRETSNQEIIILEFGTNSEFSRSLSNISKSNEKVQWHQIKFEEGDFLNSMLAFLYQCGYDLDWEAIFSKTSRKKLPLPSYQFDRKRCWIRTTPKADGYNGAAASGTNDSRPKTSFLKEEGTYIEERIAQSWAELLEVEEVSIEANFFELGGDSLKATKFINAMNKAFDIRLDFEDAFDFPILSAFADYLSGELSTEQKVAHHWKEVLKLDHVAPEDNFFELGGHSLIATQIINRIKKDYKTDLNFEDIFKAPTLGEFSTYLDTVLSREEALSDDAQDLIPVEEQDHYELSPTQRRVWLLSQFDDASVAYNNFDVFSISNQLDKEVLLETLHVIVERHETLRTSFEVVDGLPKQKIWPTNEIALDIQTINLKSEKAVGDFGDIASAEALTPFKLNAPPLFRVSVIHTSESTYILLNIHHIISDYWSARIMFKEILKVYQQLLIGGSANLSPLQIQYKDYTAWLYKQLESDQMIQHEQYWLDKFATPVEDLKLPYDRKRTPLKTFNGSYFQKTLDKDLVPAVIDFAKRSDATPFMVLMATVKALFYRYTGQTDIVVGMPEAGRDHVLLEDQIGFYANTVAIRTSFAEQDSFKQLVGKVKKEIIEGYEHRLYPFDVLITKLNHKRDMSHSPLFDVMIIEKRLDEDFSQGDLIYDGLDDIHSVSKFDLSIDFRWNDEVMILGVEYNTDLFDKATIQRFYEHFQKMLKTGVEDHSAGINTIDYLSDVEKSLAIRNGVPRDLTFESLPALIEKQANNLPDNPALKCGEQVLSYQSLNSRSNQMARYLKERGINKGDVVAVLLDRDVNMVVSLLALMKLGACFVPLDGSYPEERNEFIIADCKARFLLLDETKHEAVEAAVTTINVKSLDQQLAAYETGDLKLVLSGDDVLYNIYTSGSTGTPKGIAINHLAVLNQILHFTQELEIGQQQSVFSATTCAFDPFILEFLLPLINGAQLVLADTVKPDNIIETLELIDQVTPSVIQATPSLWNMLIEAGWKGNEKGLTILCGGEPLREKLFNELSMKSKTLLNIYGPSETTIWSTVKQLEKAAGSVSIGDPIQNVSVYILDKHLNPVPVNVIGEIYIGGIGVSEGYINNEDLTVKSFIDSPFEKGKKIYRTNDLAKISSDGEVIYLGRSDNQIKILGKRVEIGEVEKQISQFDHVKRVAVVVREEGEKQMLLAYVMASEEFDKEALFVFLKKSLPEFMIPAAIVKLDDFALTPNGKIDRALLPIPDLRDLSEGNYVEPETDTEKKLAAMLKSILKLDKVGIHDNFFVLGGNSLLAMKLMSQINLEFQLTVKPSAILEHLTIAEMAAYIEKETTPEGYVTFEY